MKFFQVIIVQSLVSGAMKRKNTVMISRNKQTDKKTTLESIFLRYLRNLNMKNSERIRILSITRISQDLQVGRNYGNGVTDKYIFFLMLDL